MSHKFNLDECCKLLFEVFNQSEDKWFSRAALESTGLFSHRQIREGLEQLRAEGKIICVFKRKRPFYKKYSEGIPSFDSEVSYKVLKAIALGYTMPREIAEATGLTHKAVNYQLTFLAKKGTVCRISDASWNQHCRKPFIYSIANESDAEWFRDGGNLPTDEDLDFALQITAKQPSSANAKPQQTKPTDFPLLTPKQKQFALSNPAWAQEYRRIVKENQNSVLGDRYLYYACVLPHLRYLAQGAISA